MPHSQRKPFSTLARAFIGIAAMSLLGSCTGTPEAAPTEWVTETGEGTVEKTPAPEPGEISTWPLTGIPYDGEVGPTLSVKIENSTAARPQGGLEHADVVWEELVEGGMTRFVAMFNSDMPETFGPIRSLRPMDAAIVGPVGGIFVFSGGQPAYQSTIAATGVVMVSHDAGSGGFYRNPSRRGDHTLFGTSAQLLDHGSDANASPPIFKYVHGEAPSAVTDGEPVRDVSASFPASRPSWEWEGEQWVRFEAGQPANAESGTRLSAVNVVTLRVDIRDTGNRDSSGSMVPETILTGSGAAMVFTGGHMVEGTWEKGEATDVLELVDSDGEEIALAPGNTWVELVPNSGGRVEVGR